MSSIMVVKSTPEIATTNWKKKIINYQIIVNVFSIAEKNKNTYKLF